MSYDYKILNADPNLAFAKRVALYFSVLLATVAAALTVLYILFERYLMLPISVGMILISGGISFAIGRSVSRFDYFFTDDLLRISVGERTVAEFCLKNLSVEKIAENSDFLSKTIIKFAFTNSKCILKNTLNENAKVESLWVVVYENRCYLLFLDDYARSLLGGNGNDI